MNMSACDVGSVLQAAWRILMTKPSTTSVPLSKGVGLEQQKKGSTLSEPGEVLKYSYL